jgi:predicted Zn-dependent protease
LRLLGQVQNIAALGTQLQRMVALYPEDEDLARSLISWYLSQGDTAGAENFLRELAGDDTAAPEGHIAVVQLLQAAQGAEAAQAELDRLAAANAGTPNADIYRALAAVITFEGGAADPAITTIEDILADAEPSAQTWRIRNILARLLIATDNQVGARAQVETILEQDNSNVDALKLRASWSIEDDRASDAIIDLRTALGQEPRDAEILTLMARAHEREGSLGLAGERLAAAVNVSGAAAAESLRYANFLQRNGRAAAAQSILSDARAANPGNTDVLIALANILLENGAWVQAQGVANDLREIGTAAAAEAATSLQAALLLGQNRVQDSLAFLEEEIAQGNAEIGAIVQVVQIQLQAGDLDAARTYLDTALGDHPDDATLLMLSANLHAVAGDMATAEAGFRTLIADYPEAEGPVLRLYNILRAEDRAADAAALIDAALVAQPASLNLRWVRAGELEQAGDIDGAIAIYEEMYAANSNSVTIANNLASLLAAHRDDAPSLERAATIAKRLRELEVPPFQDTYGWIAYRLGNFEEARTYLEPAAAGLADDALVQYHYGMTLAALDDTAAARTVLTRALELAGDSALPQFDIARTTLQELGE